MLSDSTTQHDPLRAWAIEQLATEHTAMQSTLLAATPESVDDAALDAAFLATLDGESLVPSKEVSAAYFVLRHSQAGGDVPHEYRAEEERRLVDEVAAFAARMFLLDVQQRTREFSELFERCESCPRAMQHLAELRGGLKVDFSKVENDDEELSTLAKYLRELFILRPEARGRRRSMILAELHGNIAPWRDATKRLRKTHADIAALDELLLDEVAYVPPTKIEIRREQRKAQKAAVRVNKSDGSSWWIVVVIFAIGSGVIRGLTTNYDSNTKPKGVPTKIDIDQLTDPNFKLNLNDTDSYALQDAIKRMQQREQDRKNQEKGVEVIKERLRENRNARQPPNINDPNREPFRLPKGFEHLDRKPPVSQPPNTHPPSTTPPRTNSTGNPALPRPPNPPR